MRHGRLAHLLIVSALVACCTVSGQAAGGAWNMNKDFFPIMPWDCPYNEDEMKSVAECNFTVAGFIKPKLLPTAEKLGLKAIIANPLDNEPWEKKWQDVPDAMIGPQIEQMVKTAGKSRAVIGYFLNDEPGTPQFHSLGKAVEALRKYAPGKLAYINLFPGYATIGAPDQSQLGADSFTDYLEKYIAAVKPDFLSYDDYMVTYSDNFLDRDLGAVYFKDLLEVRRVSLKHGIPFWNVVCSNRIRPTAIVPSPANLLFQAYTTIAAGGRGLSWYTYHDRTYGYAPLDASGRRTDTWSYLQMVNHQMKVLGPMMNRLKSTGVFFTSPMTDACPALPGRLVTSVESRASRQGSSDVSPPIMVGEFEGEDGSDYVMLVNLSFEKSANTVLRTGKDYSKREAISAQDGTAMPLDEKNGRWLVPGGGVLIRLVAR